MAKGHVSRKVGKVFYFLNTKHIMYIIRERARGERLIKRESEFKTVPCYFRAVAELDWSAKSPIRCTTPSPDQKSMT